MDDAAPVGPRRNSPLRGPSLRGFRIALALLPPLTAAPAAAVAEEPGFYGVACMGADGVVDLRLRAPLPGGAGFGEGMLRYRPGDPHYREIIDHVGRLKPGECKPVPPWPDPPRHR